ncbi:hypothetical protein CPB84DRAFT_1960247 [Gymnopilus junonius]|uniref:Uncharacterized protein n=1 Tax=Gymnopilus junonius TaxID=109634 RepID=A0A9P5NSZ8_GYMJU|nr:hypothetical protein CPB84DRAFT_1962029 [Gymnopilus junonius]KAF8905714.1 hypothetical protein CPB84DRAFT_1960247 [Gymnopilus junonius]
MDDTVTIDSPEMPSLVHGGRSNSQNYQNHGRSITTLGVHSGDFLLSFRLPDNHAASRRRIVKPHFHQRILNLIPDIPVLPASKLLHYVFHYEPDENSYPYGSLTLSDIGGRRWNTAIVGIVDTWKVCQLTSTGLVASVLAVLQIQPIFNSTTMRTLIVASFMFSCSSLVSSHLYIASKESFLKRRVIDKWKAAGDATNEFWTLVSLPVAFIMWSSAFFCATLFLLIWNDFETTAMGGSCDSNFPVCAFLTFIPVISFTKIYHAMKKFRRL